MPQRVVTVLAPGANAFEFAVACEVFGLRRPEFGAPLYDHRLAAVTHPVEANAGWHLTTPHGLEALEDAETVIVPTAPLRDIPSSLTAAVARAYSHGARIVTFCSGAFTIAEAGILDGRPATTHWMYVEELQRRFPRVQVDPDVLYVDDGQVLTAAGTAAAVDLSLHIVRCDHGAEMANKVARRMLVPPHRHGGQAQFSIKPVPRTVDADPLGPVLEWIVEYLDQPITVSELAMMAAMSPRTFARRFRESTGTTPLRWIHHQRVVRAQELLEVTDLTVDGVAARVGFGNATNLREHFRRVVRTTPSAYRAQFRRPAA